jgi:hypothetical protein
VLASLVELEGWKIFEAAAVGAVGLAFYRRRAAILMSVGGLLGAAVCVHERIQIKDLESTGIFEVDVAWSLYGTLGASLSLVVSGILLRAHVVANSRHA